jgi:Polyketide cyclase / dehydrase and lipid transport
MICGVDIVDACRLVMVVGGVFRGVGQLELELGDLRLERLGLVVPAVVPSRLALDHQLLDLQLNTRRMVCQPGIGHVTSYTQEGCRPGVGLTVAAVDLRSVAELDWPPATVFAEVRDLAGYPDWLGIVHRVTADRPAQATSPAWLVDIGARIGPVRRSKQVRMLRTADEPVSLVRFERAETDGRTHSPWILTARIEPAGSGARLTMDLHYGGRAWLPLAELALRQEIVRAGRRLSERLALHP